MAQPMQRSFTSGELAPALRSRADLNKFTNGLALCQNMFPRAQGGCYSRPGFLFAGEVGNSANIARVIPFSFNTDQTYILVFQNLTMRVIIDGAFVLAGGGGIFELAVPYTSAQLFRLSFVQDADTMTMVHRDQAIATITRTAHDAWQHTVVNYGSTVAVPTGVALGTSGTASTAVNKTYSYVVTAVDDLGVESLQSAKVTQTVSAYTQTWGGKLTWTAVAGADYYRVYKDVNDNTDIFGWIGDSETLEFTDFNIAPLTEDSPLIDRTPLTGAGKTPSTVGYHDQRQVFANNLEEPQTFFTTQIANDNSFRKSRNIKDSDAITQKIKSTQVNEIRHIISGDDLLFGTSGGVWKATMDSDGSFTPSVGVKLQTRAGMSWVQPAVINDSIVYVQEKGSRIRDLNYTYEKDKYAGDDLSIMSEHLFENHKIVEMVYAEEPYGILWCVRDDGILLGMTYQKEHKVWGWHQHNTDGFFESITSIKEGDRDAVYVVVRRTINGATVRYVERMEPRETNDVTDCFYVDSGARYSGAPITEVTAGAAHLEGQDIVCLADGDVINGLTFTGGAFTLTYAVSKLTFGLRYLPAMETLDLESTGKSGGETIKPDSLSVSEVTVETHDTRGLWIGGLTDDGAPEEMEEHAPRTQADGYDTLSLKSSKLDVTIRPSWNRGGGIRIEQRDPLPMAILSVSPKVIIGGN